MPSFRLSLAAVCLVATMASFSAHAQKAATPDNIAADCGNDLRSFCSQVLPGGDRPVACLIAHEDKISPRCRLTAYLASGSLGNRTKQLLAMAKTCSSDILAYCSNVSVGGGRIFDCLRGNRATLTDECRKGLPSFEAVLKN